MTRSLLIALLFATLWCSLPASGAPTPYDIPKLDGITVDGNIEDWDDRGFYIGVMSSNNGRILPAVDFDVQVRLGWNEDGLLVLCAVTDDILVEAKEDAELDTKDSLELHMAPGVSHVAHYRVLLGGGFLPANSTPRTYIFDSPERELFGPAQVTAFRNILEKGYLLEILVPWTNINKQATVGTEFALQIRANDTDDDADQFKAMWYQAQGDHCDSDWMYCLRLADKASAPIQALANTHYDAAVRANVKIMAPVSLEGERVAVEVQGKQLASGKLAADNGRSSVAFRFDPPASKDDLPMIVLVDGKPISESKLPSPDKARAKALIEADFNFQPYVFTGSEFPPCDFASPLEAEKCIGAYKITTTFYNKDYKEVVAPTQQGRYGAVVKITPENGPALYRYRTLCYIPDESVFFSFWRSFRPKVEPTFPEQLGIEPDVVKAQADAISTFFGDQFQHAFYQSADCAALLCGLMEAKPKKQSASVAESAFAMDRQWWVGLKRMLYDMDRAYPEPFVCPKPIEGAPAPVLRKGSLSEAGMKADAAKNIDAVCDTWAADSDEGFGVCIARHGVIVLEKAYGMRDGRPMTLQDKSWMASITKTLSATLMWMLVDQGLADFNDPVDKYFPPMREQNVEKPLRLCNLYTHTCDLWGHWGDDLHDFECLLAGIYPCLKIGQEHSYNGAGPTMGSKVAEMITGEALPQMYEKHLLGPLGCKNTFAVDSSGGSASTPRDIATVAQMLLNGGAYGNMRFFSKQTFDKVFPKDIEYIMGRPGVEWGMGITRFAGNGLGPNTFGHGAASSAVLRIDPDNDLVIVMTRNDAGKNFDDHFPQFMKAIVDSIEK